MAKLKLRESVQKASKIDVKLKGKFYRLSAEQLIKLGEAEKLSESHMSFYFENYKPATKKTNKDADQDKGAAPK